MKLFAGNNAQGVPTPGAAVPVTHPPGDISGGDPLSTRALVLGVILVAGFARLLSCWEGLPYLHNWDEPQIAGTALHMMQTGDFNPGFFSYGSVPIYLCLFTDVLHYLFLMGRPETAPPFLTGLGDIRTAFDTGWHWTISHPSFYLWNRWVFALLGTATVGVTYLLGRRLAGRWAGLAAAALLAGVGYHVQQSALIGPDVPAAFFVLCAAYASVRFAGDGRPAALLWALVFCGLAVSTKYNAAFSIAMPALALVVRFSSLSPARRLWLAAAVPAVPAGAFLAGTPYALLDFSAFLRDVGWELRHYRVLGHGKSTVTAGLPHLTLQGEAVLANLGIVVTVLAVAGLFVLARRRSGWVLLVFPTLYVPFMAGTRAGFHRNFIVVYPVAAIAFGAGALWLVEFLRSAAARRPLAAVRGARAAPSVAATAIGALLAFGMAGAAQDAWRERFSPETRSEAIRRATALTSGGVAPARVGIAEELRVHGDDLRDLDGGVETAPYLGLVCDGASYTVLVRAKRWGSHDSRMEPVARVMNALSPPGLSVRDTVGRAAFLRLDVFSTNPAIEILTRAPGGASAPDPCIGTFPASDLTLDRPYEIDGDDVVRMHTWGRLSTPWIDLPAGSYAFVWRARGTFGDGEFAKLRVTVEEAAQDGERRILREELHELTGDLRPYALEFTVEEAGFLSLNVEFTNDFYSRSKREDRDAYVADIRLLGLER
jgi:hypothetical protein